MRSADSHIAGSKIKTAMNPKIFTVAQLKVVLRESKGDEGGGKVRRVKNRRRRGESVFPACILNSPASAGSCKPALKSVNGKTNPVHQPENRKAKDQAEGNRHDRKKPQLLLMRGQCEFSPGSKVA
jgi:hypothetical protein